jgi:hypothetical protein
VSRVIQTVAVQSGFTDSVVAQGLYSIQASATPVVNFPSGFASAGGLIQLAGNGSISSGSIALLDTVNAFEASGAWFDVPVTVSTFSTTFTLNLSSVGGPNAGTTNGLCFVLQNFPQTTTGTNFNWTLGNGPFGVVTVSGGPYTLSAPGASNLGYTDIFASIAVAFDLGNSAIGLFQNGAPPTGASQSVSPVSFTSTTAISVTIAYNGTALTITMTQGANTFGPFTLSSSINIPSIVGSSQAYAGFTSGSGYSVSNTTISTWTM